MIYYPLSKDYQTFKKNFLENIEEKSEKVDVPLSNGWKDDRYIGNITDNNLWVCWLETGHFPKVYFSGEIEHSCGKLIVSGKYKIDALNAFWLILQIIFFLVLCIPCSFIGERQGIILVTIISIIYFIVLFFLNRKIMKKISELLNSL